MGGAELGLGILEYLCQETLRGEVKSEVWSMC